MLEFQEHAWWHHRWWYANPGLNRAVLEICTMPEEHQESNTWHRITTNQGVEHTSLYSSVSLSLTFSLFEAPSFLFLYCVFFLKGSELKVEIKKGFKTKSWTTRGVWKKPSAHLDSSSTHNALSGWLKRNGGFYCGGFSAASLESPEPPERGATAVLQTRPTSFIYFLWNIDACYERFKIMCLALSLLSNA